MSEGAAAPGGFFPLLRQRALVVAAVVAIALVVGYGLAQRATPTYEARTELLVGPLQADIATVRAATAATGTYAQLAEAPATLDVVARATGVDRNRLASGLRVTSDPEARILRVRVRAPTPQGAAASANGVADRLISVASEDLSNPSGHLRRVDVATPPSSPIGPGAGAIIGLAAAGGLLGGLGLVMVLVLVGDPARSASEVRRATRGSVLSLPAGPGADGVRAGEVIAVQLALERPGIRSVLFTGTSTFDGGGQLALELAAAWAASSGGRVVVVDAGAGETTAVMGLEDGVGVAEALAGATVDPTPLGGGVEALGGRNAADGPIEAAAPARVVGDLVTSGAAVVVHAPPVAVGAVTLAWARAVDVAVLVSRRDTARRGALVGAADALRHVGADLALTAVHPGGRHAR